MAIITGTGAGETLTGTAAADTITGAGGDDKALMGAGNDTFVWNSGDGSDTVEGGAGTTDTLKFKTTNASDSILLQANGDQVLLASTVDNVIMDLNDVERVHLQLLGGLDHVELDDLAGTDLKQVTVDLAVVAGLKVADGQADTVGAVATTGNDKINVALTAGAVTVTGLPYELKITNADAIDTLVISGAEGNDIINASKLPTGKMDLFLVGGFGNDTITGNKDANTLQGGTGNDLILWNAGDGADTIDGGGDIDTVRYTASTGDDTIQIDGVGTELGTLDLSGVEHLEIRTLGGADSVFVQDLSGTDVTDVVVDLAATADGKTADTKSDRSLRHRYLESATTSTSSQPVPRSR